MSRQIDKNVVVTGSNSMMGRAICHHLENKDYNVIKVTHDKCNLLDKNSCIRFFCNIKAKYLIHCAGYNGNINFNKKYPAEIFYRTTMMGLNVFDMCYAWHIPNIISLISSCAYPDNKQELLKEKDFWNGEPNPSVDAHGFAKRTLVELGRQINKEFSIKHLGIVVNTGYGPHDNYDIQKTKVVGGLITKFIKAKKELSDVLCWGSGNPRREFIYSDDVGKYVVMAMELEKHMDYPLNIGSGIDYSIRELAETIADVVGFNGNIIWDTTKPDGQMKKLLDNTQMKYLFDDLEFVSLKDGIRETVKWYEDFYINPLN